MVKEMLKRNLHNKPCSEKQFSFVNVVCSGDLPRRCHQPRHRLSDEARGISQELGWGGKKSLFLRLQFQKLWIQQGTGLHRQFNGTRASFSFSACLGRLPKEEGRRHVK